MTWFDKRHLKISLRAILLLFCLFGCVIAYFADIKRRQVEVQRTVSELGGIIWNVDFDNGRCIEPTRAEFLPDYFYVLLPERYNYVYVTSPEVDDEKLSRILKLPGIEGLNISRSTITDKGLSMLKEKSGIMEIQLYDIPTVTNEAILQLESSTSAKIQYGHSPSSK